jgi:hypothetical protein
MMLRSIVFALVLIICFTGNGFSMSGGTDAMLGVVTPGTSCTGLSSTEKIQISIYNNGEEAISDFPVSYQVNNGAFTTDTVRLKIEPGKTTVHLFSTTANLSASGKHTLAVSIHLEGDITPENDTIDFHLHNGPFVVDNSHWYANGFEGVDDLMGTVSEDANRDYRTWGGNVKANTGGLAGAFIGGKADDWFFTACVDLSPEKLYVLSYFYSNPAGGTSSAMEVRYGTEQTSERMTETLSSDSKITNTKYQRDSIIFSVSQAGAYYFGFHCFQHDSSAQLFLDDIKIALLPQHSSEQSDSYTVFPNPSSGIIKLNCGSIPVENKYVIIRNETGGKIYESDLSAAVNNQLHLEKNPAGVYLLEIADQKTGTSYKTKFIIQ